MSLYGTNDSSLDLHLSLNTYVPLFCVIGLMLVLSISLNIIFCMSRCCSGKGIFHARKRQRHSQRQMEDNPIYGNLNYMQPSLTEPELSQDQQRVELSSQSKTQDCYANLNLKAPRVQAGRSSPQMHYPDPVQVDESPELEREHEGNTDAVSTMSDLYASVQTQRAKTINSGEGGEDYANHL